MIFVGILIGFILAFIIVIPISMSSMNNLKEEYEKRLEEVYNTLEYHFVDMFSMNFETMFEMRLDKIEKQLEDRRESRYKTKASKAKAAKDDKALLDMIREGKDSDLNDSFCQFKKDIKDIEDNI